MIVTQVCRFLLHAFFVMESRQLRRYIVVMTDKRKEEAPPAKVGLPLCMNPAMPSCHCRTVGCTLRIMIRLNALDCKLKDTILHISKLFRQCLKQNPLFLMVCPYCGAKGTCRPRGSYERNLVTFSDGKPEVFRLKVPRVQCPCGRSQQAMIKYISQKLSLVKYP